MPSKKNKKVKRRDILDPDLLEELRQTLEEIVVRIEELESAVTAIFSGKKDDE